MSAPYCPALVVNYCGVHGVIPSNAGLDHGRTLHGKGWAYWAIANEIVNKGLIRE